MTGTYLHTSDSEAEERFSKAMHEEFVGDDPIDHLRWAAKLPHPWNTIVSPLSQEQITVLQETVQDPGGMHKRLIDKLHLWTRRKEELAQANAAYRESLAPHQRNIVGKIDLFLFCLLYTSPSPRD